MFDSITREDVLLVLVTVLIYHAIVNTITWSAAGYMIFGVLLALFLIAWSRTWVAK